MNIKAISRNVGAALLVSSLFMFLSAIVSILNGNDSALAAILISFVITFVVGVFPFIFVRKAPAITLLDGYAIICLAWLLSFIFGMMPYLLWGGPFTVINAFFESVSGFTTTGATILNSIEDLPNSLLFWRSSTHFIGGLGVVVFLLLILPSSNPVRLRLANMELSSLSKDYYHSRANKTFIIYTNVYLGLNLLSFLMYYFAGMSAFDAINHAFSVCATGGFSTKNFSIASFDSVPINLITIVFMYLASIHFGLLYFTVMSRSLKPFKNSVVRFYLKITFVSILLVSVLLKYTDTVSTWSKAFMDGAFYLVSIISTTGYAISDNATWPYSITIFVFVIGLMCGCAGSTTGGMKADRVYIFLKSVKRQILRITHPSAVEEVRVGSNILRDEDISPHVLFIGLYIFIAFCSMTLFLMLGMDMDNSFAASVSALGNIGPGLKTLGTFGNYNALSIPAKLLYCLDMYFGRLELYPVLAILSIIFNKFSK